MMGFNFASIRMAFAFIFVLCIYSFGAPSLAQNASTWEFGLPSHNPHLHGIVAIVKSVVIS